MLFLSASQRKNEPNLSICNLKVFSGHKELLDSGLCDVLVVSTPNMTHYSILMDIINHSKPHHVLVEKPLCTTVSHCKEVCHFVLSCLP